MRGKIFEMCLWYAVIAACHWNTDFGEWHGFMQFLYVLICIRTLADD